MGCANIPRGCVAEETGTFRPYNPSTADGYVYRTGGLGPDRVIRKCRPVPLGQIGRLSGRYDIRRTTARFQPFAVMRFSLGL